MLARFIPGHSTLRDGNGSSFVEFPHDMIYDIILQYWKSIAIDAALAILSSGIQHFHLISNVYIQVASACWICIKNLFIYFDKYKEIVTKGFIKRWLRPHQTLCNIQVFLMNRKL